VLRLFNLESSQPKAELAWTTLKVGFGITMLALMLGAYVPSIHGGAVALGVLYITCNLYILSYVFQDCIESCRTKRFIILAVLLKLPVLLFVFYLLSRAGLEYVFGGLAGIFAFVPASILVTWRS
jgi:hypothetical protein